MPFHIKERLEGKHYMLFFTFSSIMHVGSYYLLYTSTRIHAKFTLQLRQMRNGIQSIFQSKIKENTQLGKLKHHLLTVNTIYKILSCNHDFSLQNM